MAKTIRIAALQLNADPGQTAARLAHAERHITEAAAAGAQLVVLPEVFNTGYAYVDENYQRAEPLDGPTITWMRATAARLGVHLAGTLLLRDEEDIYNALILVAPTGRLWRYNKHYPWIWERAYFKGGHDITIADTELGRLGLLICWDSAHPDLWARYAGKVDAMVVCSCPPAVYALNFALPDGTRLEARDFGPLMAQMAAGVRDTFGPLLRRQAAHLGVPVVNTTTVGAFDSVLPMPRLSWAAYTLARPDLLVRYLGQAAAIRVQGGYYAETYVAAADGSVLEQVPAEQEGCAVATVTLAEAPPHPETPPPAFGLLPAVYAFDGVANTVLAGYYQRNVRAFWGTQMAPLTATTRRWGIGLGLAAGVAFVLGWWLGRRR